MFVAISNIIAFLGGVFVIGLLIWFAIRGTGEREAEEAAREYFDEHGHWPDEAPAPPA